MQGKRKGATADGRDRREGALPTQQTSRLPLHDSTLQSFTTKAMITASLRGTDGVTTVDSGHMDTSIMVSCLVFSTQYCTWPTKSSKKAEAGSYSQWVLEQCLVHSRYSVPAC